VDDLVVASILDRFEADSTSRSDPEVRQALLLHVADAIGCALGAQDGEAVRIAVQVARPGRTGDRARVVARPGTFGIEDAAFANTAMIRYLDLNDTYNQSGSGHPSDLVGVALAAATQAGRSGSDLVAAVDAAYDCLCDLWDQASIGRHGWDQGTMVGPVAAATAGWLLGLSRDQVGEAVAMTTVSGVALRQTRRGELSMWKGLATAHASRSAAATVRLAALGASGPPQPFVGANALGELVFDRPPAAVTTRGAILRANLKRYPCCFHGQAPIELASGWTGRIAPESIATIEVETYEKAVVDLALDEEKWHPEIRESADHSLPFLVAVGLLDGGLTEESFAGERWFDPRVVDLMAKVRVRVDPELDAHFPRRLAARMRVTYDGGSVDQQEVGHPRGHHQRAIDADDLRLKFLELAGPRLGRGRAEQLHGRLARLDEVDDLDEVLDLTLPA